jgi:quercetin dioxygenase-like cupin family protein
MALTKPFMVGPLEDRSRPWRVVVGPDEANGMALGDGRIPPHAPGPGRHVHTHEDEGIYGVSGVLTVEVGESRFEAGPERFVWMPRGVPHTFANLSDEEVWTVGLLNPTGLEEMFREQAAYFARFQGPPDADALMELSARYGVYPVGGPPLQRSR